MKVIQGRVIYLPTVLHFIGEYQTTDRKLLTAYVKNCFITFRFKLLQTFLSSIAFLV